MQKYKIGDTVVCKDGDNIGKIFTIKDFRHEYYYNHTVYNYGCWFGENDVRPSNNNNWEEKDKTIRYRLDHKITISESQLIEPMKERDDNIEQLLDIEPKYKEGDIVYCIPGLVYDYYLNKRLTIDNSYKQINGDKVIFMYSFIEEHQQIAEFALTTKEELRDNKLESILK